MAAEAAALQRTAERLAEIDCLRALADVAVARSYVRPRFTDDGRHEIVDGRHPVLEALQPDPPFVANDCFLSPRDCQVALITGPNMAGKSTFIRQVALVTLMAQMGSFVPAREARLHLVDRIFTRVGAMDHLARGQSTFLVEMTENMFSDEIRRLEVLEHKIEAELASALSVSAARPRREARRAGSASLRI